jgi:hypothetical protein
MAKIAHQNTRKDGSATESDQALGQAARAAGATAVAETDRLARAASGGSPEGDATSIMEILGDQTRSSLEAATALGRARTLAEAAQLQSDFIGSSFSRMGRLNERCLALLRGGMMTLPPSARR